MTTKTSCDHESTHFFFLHLALIFTSVHVLLLRFFFLFIIYYYVIFNSINLNI